MLDTSRIEGDLTVRYANGDETYETFGGDIEHPEQDEVIFADDASRVHARRWTNRQSGSSAVRDSTSSVLIVSEALHETAGEDVRRLMDDLSRGIDAVWGSMTSPTILTADAPVFTINHHTPGDA